MAQTYHRISRAQRSMKWCAAKPGSLQMPSMDDPGSAVHRPSALKTRVNGVMALALHRIRERRFSKIP
jgi:hypothetical protein